MSEEELMEAWPIFVVGQVGTDLDTEVLDSDNAVELSDILQSFDAFLKVHYFDYVENPEDLGEIGAGAANVGPEFTEFEFKSLKELVGIEEALAKKGEISTPSNFMEVLSEALKDSSRWKKWLKPEEKDKDFFELDEERRDWLLSTGARYVWGDSDVIESRSVLYENLKAEGYLPETIVESRIESAIDRYYHSFNLKNTGRLLKR